MLTSEIEMIPTVPSFCQTCINNSQSKRKRQYGASPSRFLSCNSQYICRNGTADFPRPEGYNVFGVLDELLSAEGRLLCTSQCKTLFKTFFVLKQPCSQRPEKRSRGLVVIYEAESLREDLSSVLLVGIPICRSIFVVNRFVFIWGRDEGTARWPTVCAPRKMGTCY